MSRKSLLVLMAIGMLASCVTTRQSPITKPAGTKPASGKDSKVLIAESLKILPEKMRSAIIAVEVRDDASHYNSVLDDGKWISAHCHHERKICIKSQVLAEQPSVLWHEAGHAYARFLCESNSQFLYTWCCIRGGTLTGYGNQSAMEDIADWTSEAYLFSCGKASALDDLKKKSAQELAPYQLKLLALYDYGFIDRALYDKISKLIKKP